MNNSAQQLSASQHQLSDKIDVIYEPDAANPAVSLQYSTWTDDLGWCVQRTIPVNAALLDDLHRALSAARCKVKNAALKSADDERNTANVIAFPQFNSVC